MICLFGICLFGICLLGICLFGTRIFVIRLLAMRLLLVSVYLVLVSGMFLGTAAADDASSTKLPSQGFVKKWSSAISNDRDDLLAQMLDAHIESGLDPVKLLSIDAPNGKSALMVASKQGDLNLVRRMVGAGASINELTQTGGTPFMFAVLGDQIHIAKWLHAQGANIDSQGSNGWSAATIAGAKGQTAMLRWLIEAGADINAVDVYRFTPLMRAVDNQHQQAVSTLLSLGGAKVNVQDESDNSALHFAVANGHSEVIAMLLQHGANPLQKNRDGMTPIDLAKPDPALRALFKQ